jgi:ATP-binding cassette subfamily B protein
MIRFERVGFAYPGGRDVLVGLDLEIPIGRSLAIVGFNGAGKTTAVKLLAGLYRPSRGRITVDSTDLAAVDARGWQRHVAAIFQDFGRYPLTARENIGWGAPAHLDDEAGIRRAAELAGAMAVIDGLPAGFDTVLDRRFEGGAEASGGEWQRIAIARALFAVHHGASVLVLDEPTAQLDARAEADIYDRFLKLTTGVTTVVVSHRFSTIRRADRIVVLEDGAIIEAGAHDDLIARAGRYAELFRVQADALVGGNGRANE